MNLLKELKFKDFVTFCGTACGISSIILSLEGQLPYIFPAFLIFLAIFMDTLDGYFARKLNQINDLGKELDSLSDLICFGVAPAVFVYATYTTTNEVLFSGINGFTSYVLLLPCIIFVLAAIIRLAGFNVDEGEGYTGIPTPISAGFIVILFQFDFFWYITVWDPSLSSVMMYVIPVMMCVLAYLNITPYVVYGKNVRKKKGFFKFLLILIVILALITWIMSFFWNITSPYIVGIIILIIGLNFIWILYGFFNYFKFRGKEKNQ